MSKEFANAMTGRRIILVCVLLFCAIANSSLFPLRSSQLSAQVKTGMASYYSLRSAGSITASGERLSKDSLTCAHRTLPFGTLLKVTNLNNGRSVIVRVNDRGPYIRDRIIDLSWRAAYELRMISHGTTKVTVEEAYSITIPLRPDPIKLELPKITTEHIELPDTLRAIWQEDQLTYHEKKKKRASRSK